MAWKRLVRFGLALAASAVLSFLLAGAAIALGATPLFARVTFTSVTGRLLRLVVDGLLVLLGF